MVWTHCGQLRHFSKDLVNQLNRAFAVITKKIVHVVILIVVTEAGAAKVDPTSTGLTEAPTFPGTQGKILVAPGEVMSSTHVAQVRLVIRFINVVLHTLVT